MHIKKIATKKVSDSIVEQIEEMIKSGMIDAGEKLPSVRELGEMFGVGRSAVRDAITILKGKGVVEVKQGDGAYILKFTSTRLFNNDLLVPNSKDIKELFQVRKLLEAGIVEMAAINRTEADLLFMEKSLINDSMEGWESDYHFHTAIAKAAGNQIIIQLIQLISTLMKNAMIDFHHYIEKNPSTLQVIERQHLRIYECIKLAKPLEAKEMMIEHLNIVENLLLKSHVLKVLPG